MELLCTCGCEFSKHARTISQQCRGCPCQKYKMSDEANLEFARRLSEQRVYDMQKKLEQEK